MSYLRVELLIHFDATRAFGDDDAAIERVRALVSETIPKQLHLAAYTNGGEVDIVTSRINTVHDRLWQSLHERP